MKLRHAMAARRKLASRGVATLTVVMVLFFIVALTAAYLGRTLIFEQRTSANYYRSVQAFEAADAALEWATAMLNGGRIDANCQAVNDNTQTTFRQRYLQIDTTSGLVQARRWLDAGVARELEPQCVRAAVGWTCSCPDAGTAALAVPNLGSTAPAFRVRFETLDVPGTVRISAVGCTALSADCLRDGQGTQGDAAVRTSVVVALAPGLAVPPVAALTARGDVNTGAATLGVNNTDVQFNGITINAGGAVSAAGARLITVPGSDAARSLAPDDASLAGLSENEFFRSFLGSSRTTYRTQPAAVPLICGGACAAALADAVAANPGRVIWVSDDLVIDSDTTIGSAAEPAMIVVDGEVRLATAGIRVYGVIYSTAANWANDGGNALVQGGVIAQGRFTGTGTPVLHFDANILSTLRRSTGSFVRVPGSWRDF